VAAVTAASVFVLWRFPLAVSDLLGSVVSAYLAAVTTVVALVRVVWPPPPANRSARREPVENLADDLAATLHAQWRAEAAARALDDPHIVPLTWRSTLGDVADTTAAVLGLHGPSRDAAYSTARRSAGPAPGLSGRDDPEPGAGVEVAVTEVGGVRIVGRALTGRLDGRFGDAVAGLAADYRRIPSGRLVVLGEPGSGKTVVAIMLTLGLLAQRVPEDPVPVLLNVASWDPLTQPLDGWIVTSVAQAHYDHRIEIPAALWREGRILPVLDGLDEIPETTRRWAVRAINEVIGSHRPIVVTCRSVEYGDVIAGGSPVLHRAPVVELQPVAVDDLVAYVRAVPWPDANAWEPVIDHLRRSPKGALAQALGTPLMISFSRRIYQRLTRSPAELIDENRFPSCHAVEDHVLGLFVAAAYAPQRRTVPGNPAPAPDGRWPAESAERWLRYLARCLHGRRERDIAWWGLSDLLLSRWAAPTLGLMLGTVTTLGTTAAGIAVDPGWDVEEDALGVASMAGLLVWILAMLVWYALPSRPPARLSFAVSGSFGRLRRGMVVGLGIASFPALVALVTFAIGILSTGDLAYTSGFRYLQTAVTIAAIGAVVAVAVGTYAWLGAPPERSVRATPRQSLRHDRRSSVVGAGAAGLVMAILWLPATALALGVSAALMRWPGSPTGRGTAWTDVTAAVHGASPAQAAGLIVLPGFVVGLLLLLVRAWPRFVVVRAHQAVRRQLPLRLMGFLADAHQRGVLRESGGVYQFAHVRLQEQLADTRPVDWDTARAEAAARSRHRRRLGLVAAGAAALALSLGVPFLPADTSTAATEVPRVTTMVFDPHTDSLLLASYDGLLRWERPWDDSAPGPKSLDIGTCRNVDELRVGRRTLVARCSDKGDEVVAWHRDGDRAPWHPGRRSQLSAWSSGSRRAGTVTLDHDGEQVAGLTGNGTIWSWDPTAADAPRTIGRLPFAGLPTVSAASSPTDVWYDGNVAFDGTRIAVHAWAISDDARTWISPYVYVWMADDPTQAPAILQAPSDLARLSFSPGGDLTACSPAGPQRLDVDSVTNAAPPRTLPLADRPPPPRADSGCQFLNSPSGDTTHVRRPAGRARQLRGHTGRIVASAYLHAPDDSGDSPVHYLATAATDNTVRLWSLADLPTRP
jgi:hypothetical protein